jgi:hypothetical protein
MTIEYDLYVRQILDEAGVTELLMAQAAIPEEQREAAGTLFMRRIANAGKGAALIAAFIKPKHRPWSAAWAEETAKKLGALTAKPEKDLMFVILYKGVADFFLRGRRSSKTSRWS